MNAPFQQALDLVEQLPIKDQETLLDIIQRRVIDLYRSEISRNARDPHQSIPHETMPDETRDDSQKDSQSHPVSHDPTV